MRGRIRTIKPDIGKDEDLWDLYEETGLPVYQAFTLLWCYADREGRFEWRPRALKTDILPYWEGDFSRVLDALATRGFIVKYTVDGRDYGLVKSFVRHQVVNCREKASGFPAPPDPRVEHASSTREARDDTVVSTDPTGSAKAGPVTNPTEQPIEQPSPAESPEESAETMGKQPDPNASSTRHPRVTHASSTRHVRAQGEGKGREGNGNGNGNGMVASSTRAARAETPPQSPQERREPRGAPKDAIAGPESDTEGLCSGQTGHGPSETKNALARPSRPSKGQPAKKRVRGARFVPDGWSPQPRHVELARQLGVHLERERAKFTAHEFRTPRTDWDRAFTGWLHRASEIPGNQQQTPQAEVHPGIELLYGRVSSWS